MDLGDRIFLFAGVGIVLFVGLNEAVSAVSVGVCAVVAALVVLAVEGATSK